jgi:hypothetical protein
MNCSRYSTGRQRRRVGGKDVMRKSGDHIEVVGGKDVMRKSGDHIDMVITIIKCIVINAYLIPNTERERQRGRALLSLSHLPLFSSIFSCAHSAG